MAKQPKRTRRFMRSVLIGLAITAWLLATYLSSWFLTWYAFGHGWVSRGVLTFLLDTVFLPVMWYRDSGWAGVNEFLEWTAAVHNPRQWSPPVELRRR